MAAFYDEGIDNALVEVDADEIPIMELGLRSMINL